MVAKYAREVIDRVRVDEANRLRHDKPARKVIKGAKWLLLRNRENVPTEDRVKLVRYAYDRGIRHFDLADMYGTHPYVGRVLKDKPRDGVQLVTKIWTHRGGIPEVGFPGAGMAAPTDSYYGTPISVLTEIDVSDPSDPS